MEIPHYIKTSNFYLEFDQDENIDYNYLLSLNIEHLEFNFKTNNEDKENIIKLIKMLAFWGVNEIPYEYLDFIILVFSNKKLFKEIEKDLESNDYFNILAEYTLDDDLLTYSIINNNKYLLNYYLYRANKNKYFIPTFNACIDVQYIIIKTYPGQINSFIGFEKGANFVYKSLQKLDYTIKSYSDDNIPFLVSDDNPKNIELNIFNNKYKIHDFCFTRLIYSTFSDLNRSECIYEHGKILINSDLQEGEFEVLKNKIKSNCIDDSGSLVIEISSDGKLPPQIIYENLFEASYEDENRHAFPLFKLDCLKNIKYYKGIKTLVFDFLGDY